MDSLLVVLSVIGVILILAGIARMRSRRKHHRDEIDHSVLFDSKYNNDDVLLDDEVVIRRITKVESSSEPEPLIQAELHDLDEADQPRIDVADEVRIEMDETEGTRSVVRSSGRSILGKLGLDSKEEEEQPEVLVGKQYRDSAPEKVIVLNVMAPKGQHFKGAALVDAVESLGMVYGEMEIFHLYSDNEPLFSLVNMVKPGVFDMLTIDTFTTPGISLFIQLPNKQGNGLEAFDTMLEVAQRLNSTLGGSLCDERRNILTHSAIDYTRQQLAEYDCKWLAPA